MERKLGPVSPSWREREKKKEEKHCSCTLYFSLVIVKSLQLRRSRQIAKPCKYYLMRVIVFFDMCFLFFFFFSS